MTLIKTSLLNATAVMIKMLTMLGINKILAIYVGPSGYAALGQFQNAVQMITTFGSGAISTGVTKYTAEYFQDENQQQKVWKTAGTVAFVGAIFVGGLVVIFNQVLASWFLKDIKYGGVFIWFGLTLIFFVFNTLLLSILNGKKEIASYVIANVAGSIFSLTISAVMIVKFGLYGALLTLAIHQSLTFFVTLTLCYRKSWFKLKYIAGSIDKKTLLDLGKYTVMALVSATVVPISHILVRNHLGETLGWDAAGFWEAMWRLSTTYLMLVTTTLGVYYLPRFSEIKEPQSIKNEIIKGYKIIVPASVFFGLFIYLFRDPIIRMLFTKDFYPMRELFLWQTLGDTLKIGGWILAYLMLSKTLLKIFISTEIFFSLNFVGLTYVLIPSLGLKAPVVAHAINYALYWIAMLFVVRYFLLKK